MAQSADDLANQALAILGAETIGSISDNTHNARVINTKLDVVRLKLLRGHYWNFARARTQPSLLTVSDVTDSGGLIKITTSSAHGLSTGQKATVIEVKGTHEANGTWTITVTSTTEFTLDDSEFTNAYVSGGKTGRAPAFGYDWSHALPSDYLRLISIDGSSEGPWRVESGRLLTDIQEPKIAYVKDVTDYTAMDPSFYDVLAYAVATDVCMRVTQDNGLRQELAQEFRERLRQAKFVDATEDSITEIEADTWINSRFGEPVPRAK